MKKLYASGVLEDDEGDGVNNDIKKELEKLGYSNVEVSGDRGGVFIDGSKPYVEGTPTKFTIKIAIEVEIDVEMDEE